MNILWKFYSFQLEKHCQICQIIQFLWPPLFMDFHFLWIYTFWPKWSQGLLPLHGRILPHTVSTKTSAHSSSNPLPFFSGVFIICWLPFFLTHVLKAHCRSCCISPSLYSAVTWLGYLNSAVNPVIYTTFNIEFRKAFIKILHCWELERWEASTVKKKKKADVGLWSEVRDGRCWFWFTRSGRQ